MEREVAGIEYADFSVGVGAGEPAPIARESEGRGPAERRRKRSKKFIRPELANLNGQAVGAAAMRVPSGEKAMASISAASLRS